MITIRKGDERGSSKLNWLDSRHTFSFGDYYDPQHMGFRDLRVLNEDRVIPAAGFPTHSHRDMEIITYVLEGELAHKDSTGTSSIIKVGDVQRMSAGTGISHSEYNASQTEPVHFLQIWVLPDAQGLHPGYEQRSFKLDENRGEWIPVVAPNGRDGTVTVHQDIELLVATLSQRQQLSYRLKPERHTWLQLARGGVSLDGTVLNAGDGAAISIAEIAEIQAVDDAEILLFDCVRSSTPCNRRHLGMRKPIEKNNGWIISQAPTLI
jgi:quercetin 2,3-dioxygenase